MSTEQSDAKILEVEALVKQSFTKEALARYGNIRAAHPQKAVQILSILAPMIQESKIKQVDDQQLKQMLKGLAQKKEIKIKRM